MPPAPAQLPRAGPPPGLRRWRRLLQNLFRFLNTVSSSVLTTGATSLHPNLRDRILMSYFQTVPSVASLTTVGQSAAAALSYPNSPETCLHRQKLSNYGAAGVSIRLCTLCGSRWVVAKTGQVMQAKPKAHPTAKTPLGIPKPDKWPRPPPPDLLSDPWEEAAAQLPQSRLSQRSSRGSPPSSASMGTGGEATSNVPTTTKPHLAQASSSQPTQFDLEANDPYADHDMMSFVGQEDAGAEEEYNFPEDW